MLYKLPTPIIIKIGLYDIKNMRALNKKFHTILNPHWIRRYIPRYADDITAIKCAIKSNTLSKIDIDRLLMHTNNAEILMLIEKEYPDIYISPALHKLIIGGEPEINCGIIAECVENKMYHIKRVIFHANLNDNQLIKITRDAVKFKKTNVIGCFEFWRIKNIGNIYTDEFIMYIAAHNKLLFNIISVTLRDDLALKIYAANKIKITAIKPNLYDHAVDFIKNNDIISLYNFADLYNYRLLCDANIVNKLINYIFTSNFSGGIILKTLSILVQVLKKNKHIYNPPIINNAAIKMICNVYNKFNYNTNYIIEVFNTAIKRGNLQIICFILYIHKKYAVIKISDPKSLDEICNIYNCVKEGAAYYLNDIINVYNSLYKFKPQPSPQLEAWQKIKRDFYNYLIDRYPKSL